MNRLRISEIFRSVQGEGIWLGVPSVFVRVSGCNLRCVWCDTPYASWRPEGPVRSVEHVAREVLALGDRHVVLTGGEPLLFPGVAELATKLRAEGRVITVETAGTVDLDVAVDLMSISPKLAHSTPDGPWAAAHERRRLDFGVLERLRTRHDCQFKFVVKDVGDFAEIDAIMAALGPVEPERILVMPEGVAPEVVREGMHRLLPETILRGWRLSPRLHIDLFGDTRGT